MLNPSLQSKNKSHLVMMSNLFDVVEFTIILLRVFASVRTLFCNFVVVIFSGMGIRVMMASLNELGSVLCSISWETLSTGVDFSLSGRVTSKVMWSWAFLFGSFFITDPIS